MIAASLLLSLLPGLAQERNGKSEWEQSVVSVDVTRKQYDYQQPWSKRVRNVQKNGVVIGPREILTTAEDLADRTLVRVQKGGRGRWSNAEVKWIDYQVNLAIVTSADETLWKGLKPVELAPLVSSKEPMQILRWRAGKLEDRKTEFNQFKVDEGKLSFVPHLQFDISSEINGVGWAEPVVAGGKIVGLAYSQTGNTCEIIPSSFIAAILDARKQGSYTGLGYFDFTWQPAENLAIHKFLKLSGEPRGVVVTDVGQTPEGKASLRQRDILLQVDGFDIDIQGDYEDPDYGHLMLENLSTRKKWAGSEVRLKIWRDGKEQDVTYRLPKADYSAKLMPDWVFDQEPEYLVVGGLVFQPLSNMYLRSWGEDWKRRAPFRLNYFNNEEPTKERPAVVVLSLVLPDLFNLGYQDSRYLVLEQVNGKRVSRLGELQEALKNPKDGFHKLDFLHGESLHRMVLDASEVEGATERVLKRYGIAKDHVFAAAAEKQTAQ